MDQARARRGPRARGHLPYLAGSANLSQLLPAWAHEGGTDWGSSEPVLAGLYNEPDSS
jgi:hypothetical protein